MQEKKLPVEEMVAYDEFTDRVEILRELDLWVKNIQKMSAPSTAIIAPRRMGNTALLDRLVNTVFFKPKYQVAPFYFRMKREDSISICQTITILMIFLQLMGELSNSHISKERQMKDTWCVIK